MSDPNGHAIGEYTTSGQPVKAPFAVGILSPQAIVVITPKPLPALAARQPANTKAPAPKSHFRILFVTGSLIILGSVLLAFAIINRRKRSKE